MNHDEFERLAELAFEGRASAQERERLEALAAGDPGLRGRWEDLQAARIGLAGAGLEPLPAGLHEALLSVARTEGRPRAERAGWLSFITAAIQVRPVFALGGAVAAGFAIGVVGLGLIMGGAGPVRDLAPSTSASLPPAPPAMTSAVLDQGGARVSLTARRDGAGAIVRLDARDAAPGTVTLAWDPAATRLAGIRWQGSEAPLFTPGPGRLALPLPSAAGIELSFEEMVSVGSAVRATLSAGGGEDEITLRLPR